jgi:hemolysin activation/secretion protein
VWVAITAILGGGSWPAFGAAIDAQTASTPAASLDINEFRVLGNHVLPVATIERAVYPYLGPGRSIETLKQAADALEKAYKSAGYSTVFVDVPEQKVTDGVVRLKVTEGRLERVQVRGERYFSGGQILAELPSLQVGQTPNLPELQQQLTALNGVSSDRSVAPILKAGTEPGTVDVDLAVKDSLPLHGSLQYDNRHTAYTTPNRATASVDYDNLWQRQDTLALQYQTAPAKPSDAEVFTANYSGHVGSDGALAALSYIHTASNVLALGTLGVLGKGSIYGAHWIEPLMSSSTTSQSFNIGVDYKDVLTSVLPDSTNSSSGSSGSTGSSAPVPVNALVHYLNWSAMFTGNWWLPGRTYAFSSGIGFGVRSVFNSEDQFENARYNAHPDYFYVRMNAVATQTLPAGFALMEKMSGQWSDSPLVNNEQFSIGGVDTVRGYLEAEALGDTGAAGTLEVHSPHAGAWAGKFLSPMYGLVFIDGGVATLVDPLAAQLENITLWSTGLGVRLDNSYGVSGALDFAVPERTGVRTRKDESRVDFMVRYGF